MTVEPASTRANRINSDSLDWSYIGISFTVGHSTSARRAGGGSRLVPRSTPPEWPQRRARGGRGGDPRLIHRLPQPDGRRWPALRQPGRVHLRGLRQCLCVDILPDVRQFSISNGNGEDPIVLERLIRGFDFPPSEADDQNPVSLRYVFRGCWG